VRRRVGPTQVARITLVTSVDHTEAGIAPGRTTFIERLKAITPRKAPADPRTSDGTCFRQAATIARRHRARSLELRATTSLARLWQRQGRRTEGHAALAAVYGTYTEGLTTPDLVDSAAQLNSLA
jgi:adenylate cyclase